MATEGYRYRSAIAGVLLNLSRRAHRRDELSIVAGAAGRHERTVKHRRPPMRGAMPPIVECGQQSVDALFKEPE